MNFLHHLLEEKLRSRTIEHFRRVDGRAKITATWAIFEYQLK